MNKEIDLLGENADNCKKTLLNTLNEVIKNLRKYLMKQWKEKLHLLNLHIGWVL